MRAKGEYQNNPVAKKMIVTERDPAKMRVRAKIEDEDDIETYWLDILSSSSSSTKSFNMPDEGDEVWAMVDAKGEEGFVVGSRYNDVDTPPNDTNDDWSFSGPWGSIHINKANGELTVTLSKATLNIDVINVAGQRIDHNGRNIGHDHTHSGIVSGPSNTGTPNP